MSNYVEIKSSIAEMLTIANGLRLQGKALEEQIQPLLDDIAKRDTAKTFPPDDFTDPFVKNYHEMIQGADGKDHGKSEAVRLGATGVGTAMTNLGDFVAKAMWNYQGADDDNAKDINNAGGG